MNKYYIDRKNGVLIEAVKGSVEALGCESLKELIPGSTDAATEKHVPVWSQEGNIVTVSVGSVEHPMQDVHYIEWISIITENGMQRKYLKPGEKPMAQFALLPGEKVLQVLEHCNLHGLWKA